MRKKLYLDCTIIEKKLQREIYIVMFLREEKMHRMMEDG